MATEEKGRSMVEMLGVLTIIGVLSVGAIAGYSKAMLKYKLNKQSEQLNTLIVSLLTHADGLILNNGYQNLTSVFIELNEIPKEMIKSSTLYVYDVFNTQIELSVFYTNPGKSFRIAFKMSDKGENENREVCKNILTVSKEHRQEIEFLIFVSTDNQSSTGIAGDAKCNNSGICLKDLNIDIIHNFCSTLENKRQITLQIGR